MTNIQSKKAYAGIWDKKREREREKERERERRREREKEAGWEIRLSI